MCSCEIAQHLRGKLLHPSNNPGNVLSLRNTTCTLALQLHPCNKHKQRQPPKKLLWSITCSSREKGVQTTPPQAFSFKEGFFYPPLPPSQYDSVYELLISHCILLCGAVVVYIPHYNKVKSKKSAMSLLKQFVPVWKQQNTGRFAHVCVTS